jgi:thioesterase domain-containing protein
VRPLDPSRFLVSNADGTRIPLVMVTVWWEDDQRVRALAEALGPDQPIVAVLTPPLVDGRLPATAHAWAERIGPAFDELALDTPGGPGLRLIGYSYGGTVALEAARGRLQAGRPVAWLGLIDVMRPRPNPRRAGTWLRYNLVEALSIDDRATRRRFLTRRTRDVLQSRSEPLVRRARSILRGARGRGADGMPGGGPAMAEDMRAIIVGYLKYDPTSYDQPVALFTTAGTTERSGGDPSQRWAPFLRRGFSVTDIAGDHFTIFEPENVGSLAAALRSRLDALDAALAQ